MRKDDEITVAAETAHSCLSFDFSASKSAWFFSFFFGRCLFSRATQYFRKANVLVNFLRTDSLNSCQRLPTLYKRLIHDINITNEPNRTTSLPMDGNRSITTDLRHLSLTANNNTAKLTNHFTRTGLRTFYWHQLFTCNSPYSPLYNS